MKPDLLRQVTDRERENYEKDGAAILERVIPLEWIEYMRAAVDRQLKRSDQSSQNYADEGQPRFFAQAFPWLSDDAFKVWALQGPLKRIARQIMPDVQHMNFFYDQVFVKEPGATTATPWHQDFPYLPISGDQILRIWVPLDSVSAAAGAVRYLKGSHKWGVVYHPTGFKAISEITDAYRESTFQDQPDFDAEYDTHDWLIAEAEPGDAVLHHPRTVHGSPGNTTANIRRAIATIYTGDKVTWNPHPANMFNNKSLTGHVAVPGLVAGGPIDCSLFPRVWPEAAVE